jgi:hypothetical protein
MARRSLVIATIIAMLGASQAHASVPILVEGSEMESGYERTLFKHWVDADKDKCNTRNEVLISEAKVKPTIKKPCTLVGGSWISPYDGKKFTNPKLMDIDHLVPLAEAWRSGAWAWTPAQREAFANDLFDSRALVAVTASENRSKGDQDLKSWLPALNKCKYVSDWVAVKVRYSLTFDAEELRVAEQYLNSCNVTTISVTVLPGYTFATN